MRLTLRQTTSCRISVVYKKPELIGAGRNQSVEALRRPAAIAHHVFASNEHVSVK
jgi:hypothetical protein